MVEEKVDELKILKLSENSPSLMFVGLLLWVGSGVGQSRSCRKT